MPFQLENALSKVGSAYAIESVSVGKFSVMKKGASAESSFHYQLNSINNNFPCVLTHSCNSIGGHVKIQKWWQIDNNFQQFVVNTNFFVMSMVMHSRENVRFSLNTLTWTRQNDINIMQSGCNEFPLSYKIHFEWTWTYKKKIEWKMEDKLPKTQWLMAEWWWYFSDVVSSVLNTIPHLCDTMLKKSIKTQYDDIGKTCILNRIIYVLTHFLSHPYW